MKLIATVFLGALLLAALALPAAAETLVPSAPCRTPQVSVTCVRSSNQSTRGGYSMGTSETGEVLVTCTMHLEGQALHVAWSKQPQIAGSGDGVIFHGICTQNRPAD